MTFKQHHCAHAFIQLQMHKSTDALIKKMADNDISEEIISQSYSGDINDV